MLKIPGKVPDKGFYYHYKHDPDGSINNYAYEVMGVGHHTEADSCPVDPYMVVYRPLYESLVYKAGKLFDLRPLEMFLEKVAKDGNTLNRFEKIKDQKVIAELEKIRARMYGN
ncbi:MAG: DUF1653 domain-containing protein [Candidatus Pacebacteria bacterium]|nr:DUF1653 domain-containing protein [Candidatus Paceibacterota bacterium]